MFDKDKDADTEKRLTSGTLGINSRCVWVDIKVNLHLEQRRHHQKVKDVQQSRPNGEWVDLTCCNLTGSADDERRHKTAVTADVRALQLYLVVLLTEKLVIVLSRAATHFELLSIITSNQVLVTGAVLTLSVRPTSHTVLWLSSLCFDSCLSLWGFSGQEEEEAADKDKYNYWESNQPQTHGFLS